MIPPLRGPMGTCKLHRGPLESGRNDTGRRRFWVDQKRRRLEPQASRLCRACHTVPRWRGGIYIPWLRPTRPSGG